MVGEIDLFSILTLLMLFCVFMRFNCPPYTFRERERERCIVLQVLGRTMKHLSANNHRLWIGEET